MRADIIPGGTFPDYELTDHTKTRRRLSELQGIDPMILVLSRGEFCPKDDQQHLELAANYPKIRVSYTQIVTISTDNILKTNEFRDSVGAQWTFLSDADRKIQKDLDIQEYTDSYYNPMIPYMLVLKPGLVIYSVYNGYWFWGRPSFEDLRRDLREVTREVRPGWDLAAPPPPRELGGRRPLDAPPVSANRPHADRNSPVRPGKLKFSFTERAMVPVPQHQKEPAMEYLVTMTTHVPDGTPDQAVDDIRAREAAHSRELAAAGHLLRLWRPPLQPGEWRSLGLFAAADGGQLEEVLASMPLRVWRTDEVTPLAPHPNNPALVVSNAGTEFLTIFTISVPEGTPGQAVDDTEAREAQRAQELAGQGHLLRLWRLPGPSRALGLWNAGNPAEMWAILKSLPLDPWMTVETTPLTRYPSDPAMIIP